jgi:hypothetical protein
VFDPEPGLGERGLGERPSVSVVAEILSRYEAIGRWDQTVDPSSDGSRGSSDSGSMEEVVEVECCVWCIKVRGVGWKWFHARRTVVNAPRSGSSAKTNE